MGVYERGRLLNCYANENRLVCDALKGNGDLASAAARWGAASASADSRRTSFKERADALLGFIEAEIGAECVAPK